MSNDVNEFDDDFWTPLMHAVGDGDMERFESLVELGANLDVERYCCPMCDMWYCFNKADLFCAAIESGSVRIARYLRFMGVRPWSRTKSMRINGKTVREFAKELGRKDFLKSVFSVSELEPKKEQRNIFKDCLHEQVVDWPEIGKNVDEIRLLHKQVDAAQVDDISS